MDENISPLRSCDIRKLGRWSSPLKAIPQKSITRRSGFVAVTPRAKFIVYARKVEIIVRNLFKCNKIRGTTGSSGSASGSVGIMLLRARARARGRGWGWARGGRAGRDTHATVFKPELFATKLRAAAGAESVFEMRVLRNTEHVRWTLLSTWIEIWWQGGAKAREMNGRMNEECDHTSTPRERKSLPAFGNCSYYSGVKLV